MKYRKKPVIIEAKQWVADGDHEAVDGEFYPKYFKEDIPCEYCGKTLLLHGRIKTVQGEHLVCPGDWIIPETGDLKKGFYPCKPDVFKTNYEEADKLERSLE